ncbi:MAG: alpha/beta fold hydrolase [Desulfobacterales bacterium]|nr:alpha/beta fold hydrolase [Desulfobacterales bacterium]
MIKEKITLDVEGIKIVGELYLPDNNSTHATVCVCHGIPSGNPPDPADGGYPLLAEKICRQGLAVFIFNFRGTGASGGNLDLFAWTRDLKAVIDYLYSSQHVDKSRLTLLGFSGGAAVSIYVAAQDSRISSVAACACPADFALIPGFDEMPRFVEHFRSIGAIRDTDFPVSVDEWIDGFNIVCPIDYVGAIASSRLLIVHGSEDETIPLDHARMLYDRAGEPKKLVELDGAGHSLRHDERVLDVFLDWVNPG